MDMTKASTSERSQKAVDYLCGFALVTGKISWPENTLGCNPELDRLLDGHVTTALDLPAQQNAK